MITSRKKKSVLVAMSGGVDSSVACHLLKEAGYEVRGATMRTWEPKGCEMGNSRACCGYDGVEDARRVADRLGISYYVFNFEREFKEKVIDYFSGEYLRGRTPNPCIACNNHIKFRAFLRRAEALGMDAIATGHYARIARDPEGRHFTLSEGLDPKKDQSYVLFGLDQEVLSRTLLPVGAYQKDEIRRIAGALGLVNAEKPDSMEICFVPKNNYRAFLKEHKGIADRPGLVKTVSGRVVGTHRGYFRYTVGQRRGLGIAARAPYYVRTLRPEANEVIVGTKDDVSETAFRVTGLNWIGAPAREAFECHVKIRSNHEKAPAEVRPNGDGTAEVTCKTPQDAVTPGQAAVFYAARNVIGGGWIA